MFKHLFASMNEMLDEAMADYPSSSGGKRRELQEKLRALKAMSDACIEEWLQFEEKMNAVMNAAGATFSSGSEDPLDPEFAGKRSDLFMRGQGYYKLHMFDRALDQFKEMIRLDPEFTLGRIYLAMAHFRKGDLLESYTHFHILSQLTENLQLKAISFNAMGCIQAQRSNMDKASEWFTKAYRTDPSSVQPLIDSGICSEKQGGLHFPDATGRQLVE